MTTGRIRRAVLTLDCPGLTSVVAEITSKLIGLDVNITDANQLSDSRVGRFYVRLAFEAFAHEGMMRTEVEATIAEVANRFAITWALYDADRKARILIGASKSAHCLTELLHRCQSGVLPVEIVGVFSDLEDMRGLVELNEIPYYHLPITQSAAASQETSLIEVIEAAQVDLVVLARYTPILSPQVCAAVSERCIGVHPSLLSGGQAANFYDGPFARGAKMIGATAYYVTTKVEQGPIIEQGVERAGDAIAADELVRIGSELEATVLARAVLLIAERRVLLMEDRTTVFS